MEELSQMSVLVEVGERREFLFENLCAISACAVSISHTRSIVHELLYAANISIGLLNTPYRHSRRH